MAAEVELKVPADARLQLTDLIDLTVLQSIQDTFAKVFGLPTVIIDPSGRNVTNITHRVSFCEDLNRRSELAGARCAECDACAMQRAAETNHPAIFECWNGLYDCAIPIAPKGETLGYFLCGQVLTEQPDLRLVAATAEEIDVDPGTYVRALGEVRVMQLNQYEASIASMHTLAQMIAEQAAASLDNLRMLQDALSAKVDAAKLVEELEVILEAFRDSFAQPDEPSTLETIADHLQRLTPYDSCLIYTVQDGGGELIPRVVRDPNPEAFWRYRPQVGTGLWGTVAATGVRRKIDDVRLEADFEPVPGIAIEPEAMLVVPMIREGTVSGVISLSRFERRVFTEHELRILAVFSAHASQSMQVARMQAQSIRRLHEEQALGELLRAMMPGLGIDETLSAIVRHGVQLLGARAAVLECQPEPGARTELIQVSMDRAAAESLLGELAAEIESCRAAGACRVHVRAEATFLLVPLLGATEVVGCAVFESAAGSLWDQDFVDRFAHQCSLGLRNAIARGRERRVAQQNDLLSALSAELARAQSLDEVRARILARTSEIVGSDLCAVAMLDHGHDKIVLQVREGRTARELAIGLGARDRLVTARLISETTPEESVFQAWVEQLAPALAAQLGVVSHFAAPVRTPSGVVAALVVGWRSGIRAFSSEQRRLLGVIAAEVGASFASLLARAETDHSLRHRLAELQTMARLAEQITRLNEEDKILDEVLAAVQHLAALSGAVYASNEGERWTVRRILGVDDAQAREISTALSHMRIDGQPVRHDLEPGPHQLLAVPMPAFGGQRAVIAGFVERRGDAQRDIVLSTLARFGSVALENANLHSRQRSAIARLECVNENLEQILSVHAILTAEVVGGRGIQTLAESLARLIEAEVAVIGSLDDLLARSPGDSDLRWRPSSGPGAAGTVVEQVDDRHVVAVPAAVRDEILAWLVARFDSRPGQVEQAALEYAAVLVALELMREQTALEVEHRLRGGFLEELFSGAFVEDLILRQGAAFGFDLAAPSRIFVIEPCGDKLRQADRRMLYSVASEAAASWPHRHLVALEGDVVVVLIEEPSEVGPVDGDGHRFEDEVGIALRRRLPSLSCNLVASRLVRSPSDYGRAYAAARRGLDLLTLSGESGRTLSFRGLGVQEILLHVEQPAELLDFIGRYVEPIISYDAKHSSNLLQSLETFYDSSFNLQEAARRLDVHVSTLRYRLSRIEELLGVDPKLGDARLNIEVAVKARRALAVHRS